MERADTKIVFMLALAFIFLISLTSALSSTITISPTQEIGQIRSDFYGVTTAPSKFLMNGQFIDTNNDGTLETLSNITWHREKYDQSGMNVIRVDLLLQSKYSNNTKTSGNDGVNFTGDFTNYTEMFYWANQNNYKILLIGGYMPTWLADNSSGKCDSYTYCPPTNATKWANILLDAINRVTNNSLYINSLEGVEIWNEPDAGSFWMNRLGTDDINRFNNYSVLYNVTYNVIKANNSNIKVGGVALTYIPNAKNFTGNFLGNYSNKFDFFSLHHYQDNLETSSMNELNNLTYLCGLYNANCSHIIWSEYNSQSTGILNETTIGQSTNVAKNYIYHLNNYPTIVSLDFHTWSQAFNYTNNPNANTYFPSYPSLYTMLSEPKLNNYLYSAYNITKLFATNHKAGNTVINSSSSDNTIKVVASKDSSGKMYITLTNTNTTGFNITISGLSSPYKDVETGTIYTLNSTGSISIPNLASYAVMTLESVNNTIITLTNTQIGQIRPDFYGVSTGLTRWFNNGTMIDTDNNGVRELNANYTWHELMYAQSGLKFIRGDMQLENYYLNKTGGDGVNFTGNVQNISSYINFARKYNSTVLLIAKSMPTWLADNSSGNCDNLNNCPASNYTKWGNIVVDFYNRIGCTPDICMVEVWNEPDGSSFMSRANSLNKSLNYNNLYNATYNALKLNNSNIKVGGASTTATTTTIGNFILSNFMGNFSNKIDFVTYHKYWYNGNSRYDITFDNDINNIYSNISFYTVNTSRLIIVEWNVANSTIQNTSSYQQEYGERLSLPYIEALNNYPQNITMSLYVWSMYAKYYYANAGTQFPEYPYNWNMVSEPNLDNQLNMPYNITKLFAHYAPAGGVVYQSTIVEDNNVIKAVSNKISGKQNLIITNTENGVRNITLNCGSFNGNLINVNSGKLYNCNSGSVSLDTLQPYDVVYLTEPVVTTEDGYNYYYNYLGEFISSAINTEGPKSCISINNVILTTVGYVGLFLVFAIFMVILAIMFSGIKGMVMMNNVIEKAEKVEWFPIIVGVFVALLVITILISLAVIFNSQIC